MFGGTHYRPRWYARWIINEKRRQHRSESECESSCHPNQPTIETAERESNYRRVYAYATAITMARHLIRNKLTDSQGTRRHIDLCGHHGHSVFHLLFHSTTDGWPIRMPIDAIARCSCWCDRIKVTRTHSGNRVSAIIHFVLGTFSFFRSIISPLGNYQSKDVLFDATQPHPPGIREISNYGRSLAEMRTLKFVRFPFHCTRAPWNYDVALLFWIWMVLAVVFINIIIVLRVHPPAPDAIQRLWCCLFRIQIRWMVDGGPLPLPV